MLGSVLALTSFGVLVWAGTVHLIHSSALWQALRTHVALTRNTARLAAAATTACELIIGVIGLLALGGMAGGARTVSAMLIAAAGLYAVYAVYAVLILRSGVRAICGCSSHDEPLDLGTVFRAAAYSMAAAFARVTDPASLTDGTAPGELPVTVLAAVAFGTLTWRFPAAMRSAAAGATPAMNRTATPAVVTVEESRVVV